jgi:predicted transcriptional regulator
LDPRNFEAALLLMKTLCDIRKHSPMAESVARLRSAGLSQALIARTVGTTKQNVSQHLRAARWIEEQAGRRLVVDLARGLLQGI